MFTYVDSWKRYKYTLTDSARGIEFYFEENKTDFRVEIWENLNESGTEVKIYNCGRSRGCFWNEYAHKYSGRGFWFVVKLKSPALAVGMLFHMIELVRLNHGRY